MAKSVIAVIVEALVLAVLLQSSVIITSDKFIVVSINDYSTVRSVINI